MLFLRVLSNIWNMCLGPKAADMKFTAAALRGPIVSKRRSGSSSDGDRQWRNHSVHRILKGVLGPLLVKRGMEGLLGWPMNASQFTPRVHGLGFPSSYCINKCTSFVEFVCNFSLPPLCNHSSNRCPSKQKRSRSLCDSLSFLWCPNHVRKDGRVLLRQGGDRMAYARTISTTTDHTTLVQYRTLARSFLFLNVWQDVALN